MPERSRRAARPAARRAAHAAVVAALLLPGAPRAAAQVTAEPQLVFTIYGGLSEGSSLWRITAQPLVAPNSQQDTVALGRQLRPGLIAGLVTAYYPTAHWGWTGDIGFFGIGSEQRCDGPAVYKPDSRNANQQLCTTASGMHIATSVVGLLVGVTYRPTSPEAPVQAFVRATGGPGLLGNSAFIETNGVFRDSGTCAEGCLEPILQAQSQAAITWVVNFATGLSVALAPGYRVRMEARDVITSLSVATGPRDPSNSSASPATSTVVRHLPTFLFGLDIVLERRHPRRY